MAGPFIDAVRQSIADGSFVRLVLKPRTAAAASETPRRIEARLIELRGQMRISLTAHYERNTRTSNLSLEEVTTWLANELEHQPASVYLETTRKNLQWQPTATGPRVIVHRSHVEVAPPRTHDRPRHTWLDVSARPWLRALGLVDATGRPKPSAAPKYHQIERFLEIVSHQVRAAGWWSDVTMGADRQPVCTSLGATSSPKLTVVDAACGKGYLTFAVWHWLRRVAGLDAQVLGVEARPELVTNAQRIASQVGMDHLQFVVGDIATASLPNPDLLIALHACNTATDLTLLRAVELGTRVALVAPCCHQQLRPQLQAPPEWAPVLRHGLLKERLAEWLTDALRVLFLEWAGYRVRVVEFVDPQHTPRNLLLACVRVRPAFRDSYRRDRIMQLKQQFGIRVHALDPLLDGHIHQTDSSSRP
ncbi:MAG: SAM-dependent methyltransferase [Verrucomicrobiota bacterium]|nr:SAM-dependent methyltransferase [Limisphaera sp.]MDW8383045.1 SAM-dependent methyltransferase [Verrucomicrobiota bacterium]